MSKIHEENEEEIEEQPNKTINNAALVEINSYKQQSINSNKLLESIKDLYKNENYSLAKLYLFLMKLSNESDYFGVKIQRVLYQSEIALKEKNISESIRLGHKILLWINNLDLKKYNNNVIEILIQVLLNSSEVCINKSPLLSCWFLFVAKNTCMKCSIKT